VSDTGQHTSTYVSIRQHTSAYVRTGADRRWEVSDTGEAWEPNSKAEAIFSDDRWPLTRSVTGFIVGPAPQAAVMHVTAASVFVLLDQ
jgi:hypothetical protein